MENHRSILLEVGGLFGCLAKRSDINIDQLLNFIILNCPSLENYELPKRQGLDFQSAGTYLGEIVIFNLEKNGEDSLYKVHTFLHNLLNEVLRFGLLKSFNATANGVLDFSTIEAPYTMSIIEASLNSGGQERSEDFKMKALERIFAQMAKLRNEQVAWQSLIDDGCIVPNDARSWKLAPLGEYEFGELGKKLNNIFYKAPKLGLLS